MNTKTTFIFLTLLIFQKCNVSTSTFEKDQSIDAAIKQEIKPLNYKLFSGIRNNDFTIIQSLMSPELLEKSINDSNKFINEIHSLNVDSYKILDEYLVKASAAQSNVTLISGNGDENDYTFTFDCVNKNSYVSLLLLNNFGNQLLLTAV